MFDFIGRAQLLDYLPYFSDGLFISNEFTDHTRNARLLVKNVAREI